jgi:hypothetical protein
MNYETYIKNFKGHKIPEELDNLLRSKSNIDDLSQELGEAGIYFCFEENSDGWLTHWLGEQSQVVESILGIATNGAGDLLAFWLYDERDLEDAPIVFVGHEGEVSVIANNFSEMLLLLLSCFDLHPDSIPDDLDKVSDFGVTDEITLALIENGTYPPDTIEKMREREEQIEKGRTEFIKRFNLQLPNRPAALMRSAVQSHPDFQIWLDNQLSVSSPDSSM